MTTEQKLVENPYPKSWFEMYSEERQKREALEQERDFYKSVADPQQKAILSLTEQVNTLKETLKAIDEARKHNLENVYKLEAEVKTLNADIDKFEQEAESHFKLWSEQEARLAKAEELIKRWQSGLTDPSRDGSDVLNCCANDLEKALKGASE